MLFGICFQKPSPALSFAPFCYIYKLAKGSKEEERRSSDIHWSLISSKPISGKRSRIDCAALFL